MVLFANSGKKKDNDSMNSAKNPTAAQLKTMPRKVLETLLKRVETQLKHQAQADLLSAYRAAKKLALAAGCANLTDLAMIGEPIDSKEKGDRSANKDTKPKVVKPKGDPAFVHPEDKGLDLTTARTWTGKGRPPNWYLNAIDSGVTPEAMSA